MAKKRLPLAVFVFSMMLFPLSAHAQCGSEEQLAQKWETLKSQCEKISGMVPCAFGWYEADNFASALRASKDRAIVELAKSVKAFVSYDSVDSTLIEKGVAQELTVIVGKIKLENFLLANSQEIGQECGKYAENGKAMYRAVTLMALSKAFYKEAQEEIEKSEKSEQPSSSAASQPSSSSGGAATVNEKISELKQSTTPSVNLPKKSEYKQIAAKAANFLLGLVRKFLGLP